MPINLRSGRQVNIPLKTVTVKEYNPGLVGDQVMDDLMAQAELGEQIQREINEQTEVDRGAHIYRLSVRSCLSLCIITLSYFAYSLVPFYIALQPSSQSSILASPLWNGPANISSLAFEIAPAIFFNRLVYNTTGPAPPPFSQRDTESLIEQITNELLYFSFQTMFDREIEIFKASDKNITTLERYWPWAPSNNGTARYRLRKRNWEYAGVKYTEIGFLRRHVILLGMAISHLPMYVSLDAFRFWLGTLSLRFEYAIDGLLSIEVDKQDQIFFHSNQSRVPYRRIPIFSLPKKLPEGVLGILHYYNEHFAGHTVFEHQRDEGSPRSLGEACRFLDKCQAASRVPLASNKVLHPACELGRKTDRPPRELVSYLEEWAVQTRQMNISDLTSRFRGLIPTHHFVPNGTIPYLLSYPAYLSWQKDGIEQLLMMADRINKEATSHRPWYDWKGAAGYYSKPRLDESPLEYLYPELLVLGESPGEYYYPELATVARNMTLHLWRQMHDYSMAIQVVGSICRTIDEFELTIRDLVDPQDWIVDRDWWSVTIMQIHEPKYHIEEMTKIWENLNKMRRIWRILDDDTDHIDSHYLWEELVKVIEKRRQPKPARHAEGFVR